MKDALEVLQDLGLSTKKKYDVKRVSKNELLNEGDSSYRSPINGYALKVRGTTRYICILSPTEKYQAEAAWRIANHSPLGYSKINIVNQSANTPFSFYNNA